MSTGKPTGVGFGIVWDGTKWVNLQAAQPIGMVPIIHGTPQTLSQLVWIASCQSTGGTTVVDLPATPSTQMFAAVFDDQGNAGTNNITVNAGGGDQIEDPANLGTFASSCTLKLKSCAATWQYDGSGKWKVVGSAGYGGGLQGVNSVLNGVPFTMSSTQQIASCQSSGGTTVVNMDPLPSKGEMGLVFDDTDDATTNNITVNGNGANLEDPNAPGTFSASITLKVNSCSVTWIYDGAQWKISSAFYATLGSVLAVTHASPGTLSIETTKATVDSSTGTTTVTAPLLAGLLNAGVGWTFDAVDIGGQASTNAITIAGNGVNIEDPSNPGTFASSVTFHNNYGGLRYLYNGTNWKILTRNLPIPYIVTVVYGSPQTLAGNAAIALCTSTTGTTAVALCASPKGGYTNTVIDQTNDALVNNITVTASGGLNLEDPNKPGSFVSSIVISRNSGSITWIYDSANTRWKILYQGVYPNGSTSQWVTRPIMVGVISNPNTVPQRIGSLNWKPSDEAQTGVRKVWLRIVLETTNASYQANFDLIDVNNVLGNGANVEVPGSLLQTAATTGTALEVELTTAGGNLETLASTILLYARVWLTSSSAGQQATCSYAALHVQG